MIILVLNCHRLFLESGRHLPCKIPRRVTRSLFTECEKKERKWFITPELIDDVCTKASHTRSHAMPGAFIPWAYENNVILVIGVATLLAASKWGDLYHPQVSYCLTFCCYDKCQKRQRPPEQSKGIKSWVKMEKSSVQGVARSKYTRD